MILSEPFPMEISKFICLKGKNITLILTQSHGIGKTNFLHETNAALQLDRHATLIDNKPEYVEVAQARIEKMRLETGLQYKLW